MKRFSILLLLILVGMLSERNSALAAEALAQPQTPAPTTAAPAPQSPAPASAAPQALSQTSTSAQQKTPTPTLDIRIRPMALFFGIPGAELGLILAHKITLGPELHYFSGINDDRGRSLDAFEIGFKGTYHFGEITESHFYTSAAPILYYITRVRNGSNGSASANFENLGLAVTGGFQWALNQSWSARLGAGVAYKEGSRQRIVIAGRPSSLGSTQRLDATLDFTIGFMI